MTPPTLIVGDFNTPLLPIDRSSRQKLNREILKPTDIIKQMDLLDIYTIFHKHKDIFFSETHELSLKLTIYLYTRQVSTATRKLK